MMPEETDKIKALQEKIALYEDMNAYKELYTLFYNRLHAFSFSFVKSKEVAEEIVSDVFIKVWSIRAELPEISNLPVYLYTITKNFSLNYLTKNQKMRIVSLEDVEASAFFNFQSPEASLISSEVVWKINDVISHLPVQCRITFYLVKECGLKYKEVASILNISVNTVRNHVANAVKKIAQSLPASVTSGFGSYHHFSES